MKTLGIARIAATSLVLGVALTGCGNSGQGVASASDVQPASGSKKAAALSKDVAKLLAKRNGAKAVSVAEKMVAIAPNHAAYRMQLGEAYLLAGRFYAAEAAFGDALTLSPRDERVALKLALVKSALGKGQDAQDLLADHRGTLSASDYGLAMALAGNPDAGVTSLETAARAQGADARVRQNLALSYALAGRWTEARVIALQDLGPVAVDARMTQWAQFARPRSSWDQVASLLGVTPVKDAGLPVQLALNRGSAEPVQTAEADTAPRPFEFAAAAPAPAPSEAPAPVFELSSLNSPAVPSTVREVEIPAAHSEAPLIAASAHPMKRSIIVENVGPAARKPAALAVNAPTKRVAGSFKQQPVTAKPVVKVADAKPVAAKAAPVKKPVQLASAAPVSVGGGRYVVQLGAFSSVKAADQAWSATKSKVPALASFSPVKTSVQSGSASLQRLAVSGISSKAQADELCAKVKATGGTCFVRAGQEGSTVQMAAKKSTVKVAAKAPAKPAIKVAAKVQTKPEVKVASR
jgi:Flp pilus assembly protein TadD